MQNIVQPYFRLSYSSRQHCVVVMGSRKLRGPKRQRSPAAFPNTEDVCCVSWYCLPTFLLFFSFFFLQGRIMEVTGCSGNEQSQKINRAGFSWGKYLEVKKTPAFFFFFFNAVINFGDFPQESLKKKTWCAASAWFQRQKWTLFITATASFRLLWCPTPEKKHVPWEGGDRKWWWFSSVSRQEAVSNGSATPV